MANDLFMGIGGVVSGAIIVFWRKRTVRGVVEQTIAKGKRLLVPPEWQEWAILAAGTVMVLFGVIELIIYFA